MIAEYSGIYVYNLIAKATYPTIGFPLYPGDLAATLQAKYVDNWLKDSTFLCGEEPTIADFRFAPIMYFARVAVKLPDRIVKYLDDLETKVPGFKEATEGPRGFTAHKVKA